MYSKTQYQLHFLCLGGYHTFGNFCSFFSEMRVTVGFKSVSPCRCQFWIDFGWVWGPKSSPNPKKIDKKGNIKLYKILNAFLIDF